MNPMKVAIILGSGASADFFPGTAAITNELKSWNLYHEPPAHGDSRSVWTDIIGADAKGRTYFESIYEIAKGNFKNPESFLNFERLIHIALQLEYATVTQGAIDKFRPTLRAFLEFKKELGQYDNPSLSGIIASDGCIHILDWISETYTPALIERLKGSELNQFLKYLDGKRFATRIFSLNYDTQPLYSDLEFETGFRPHLECSYEGFSPKDFLDWNGNHLYCQLHGSTLFGYPSTRSDDGPLGFIARYKDVLSAQKSRGTTKTGSGNKQDGFPGVTNLMITGLRKADDILEEPYASYYHRLFSELTETNRWIIIGYGGGDSHINRCLMRARYIWSQRNVKLKIAWIGFAPDKCFDVGGDGTSFERGLPLYDNCIDSIANVLPASCFRQLAQGSWGWIKRSEVQYISDDNCNGLVSFRGTENTLRHHRNEIENFFGV